MSRLIESQLCNETEQPADRMKCLVRPTASLRRNMNLNSWNGESASKTEVPREQLEDAGPGLEKEKTGHWTEKLMKRRSRKRRSGQTELSPRNRKGGRKEGSEVWLTITVRRKGEHRYGTERRDTSTHPSRSATLSLIPNKDNMTSASAAELKQHGSCWRLLALLSRFPK